MSLQNINCNNLELINLKAAKSSKPAQSSNSGQQSNTLNNRKPLNLQAGPKPKGSAGRGGPKGNGYNLQRALGMSHANYTMVRVSISITFGGYQADKLI
jgi:hypothetical protein